VFTGGDASIRDTWHSTACTWRHKIICLSLSVKDNVTCCRSETSSDANLLTHSLLIWVTRQLQGKLGLQFLAQQQQTWPTAPLYSLLAHFKYTSSGAHMENTSEKYCMLELSCFKLCIYPVQIKTLLRAEIRVNVGLQWINVHDDEIQATVLRFCPQTKIPAEFTDRYFEMKYIDGLKKGLALLMWFRFLYFL